MPYSYDLLEEGRLVHVWSLGDCTLQDTLDLWERKRSDKGIPDEYVELADLTGATSITCSLETREKIGGMIEENLERFPRRLAFVATTPDAWKMGKLWESEADLLGRRCIVFRDFRAACIWLGIGVDISNELQKKAPQR